VSGVSAIDSPPPESDLERVACPICGRGDDELLFLKGGFRIARCPGCGLVYVNPRLTQRALTALYDAQAISPTAYYLLTRREDERSFDARLELIERYRSPGTLLDLGAGTGTFSKVARARGWQPRALDLNAASVQRCRELGIYAIRAAFPSSALQGRVFDVVVMNDFLEHVGDPVAVVRAARELLAPSGVLFITTPDVGAMVARLAGRRWLHLKPNEHLLYFDRRTITTLLEHTGFRVEVLRSIGRVRNLAVALDKLALVGELPSRLARLLVPRRVAERIDLPLNPGDEMAVIARPR